MPPLLKRSPQMRRRQLLLVNLPPDLGPIPGPLDMIRAHQPIARQSKLCAREHPGPSIKLYIKSRLPKPTVHLVRAVAERFVAVPPPVDDGFEAVDSERAVLFVAPVPDDDFGALDDVVAEVFVAVEHGFLVAAHGGGWETVKNVLGNRKGLVGDDGASGLGMALSMSSEISASLWRSVQDVKRRRQ